MKSFITVVILVILISLAVFVFGWGRDIFFASKTPSPTSTPTQSLTVSPTPPQKEIELYLPAPTDKKVGTKFVIYGKGRGFESQINYRISDAKDGRELLLGNLMINAEMGKFGYFYKEIDLKKELKALPTAIILSVFEFSAEDGSEINKTSLELEVDSNSTAVFAYFNNNNLDPEVSCNKTFAVARLVPKTQSTLKAAMEELLKGPTAAEAKLGFGTSINPGVTINSVKVSGNTTTIDFSPKLEEGVGGSCRVAAIRSQITNTAKQFSNIKNVIISINGETELILQP
jgi:hypothetical protein